MASFFDVNDVLFDPAYPNAEAYAKDYDYDLLGRPTSWSRRVFDNHLHVLRTFLERNRLLLMGCTLGLLLLILLLMMLMEKCAIILRYFVNMCYERRQLNKEKRIWEERKKYMQPEDPDRYAAVYCRSAANQLQVASVFKPVPIDLPDYEAIRFVFPQPWLMDKTYKALMIQKYEPIQEDLIEGELEDAIKQALAERRLLTRQPLSLPARLMAKQMLAKGEAKLPSGPIITPEMKLIHGWEELYRRHKKEAVMENYRWWMAQDKTLPVEAREVTEKLQPVLAHVRKPPRKPNQPDPEKVQSLERLPHTESPLDEKNRRRSSKDSGTKVRHSRKRFIANAQIITQQDDVDESAFVQELEGVELAQVARIRRAGHRRSATRREKMKEGVNRYTKKDAARHE
ncbi:unnamed protein product [Dicrocoelium dendriticum]|nr:unnamed protein product [Dicrocoelium dendriticum]